jgi:DNA mismatch repair protein PMS2
MTDLCLSPIHLAVRLFEQGLGIIEVSDDGCGIPPSSRPYIATRHATSKIKSIDEIYSGTGLTMGFRGEALFSMACVSQQLVVATRTESEELATKIVFGKDGLPLKDGRHDPQAQFPRKVGTTVAVVQPYSSLPARRADLMRRIQQERNKIFKLMEAYAIFNVGVCFQVIDIVDSGGGASRESPRMATSATSETLQETVSVLLGAKTLKSMQLVEISLDPILQRIYGENLYQWGIRGLVSKEPSVVQAMQQQSSSSRGSGAIRMVQYYSINGRVVDLPKLTDLLRKLWKAFGGKKKPTIVLDLTLPNEAFDINLSPDKQMVLLTHEKELLGLIEEYMTNLWSNASEGVFSVSQVPGPQAERIKGDQQNDAKDCDDEEEDDDDDEDADRQVMHKRRFAFVHDPSKAKMQHELEERQMWDEKKQEEHDATEPDSAEVGDKRKSCAYPPLSESSEHGKVPEQSSVKRARLSQDSEQVPTSDQGKSSDDVDMVSNNNVLAQPPTLNPSDGERRQWIGIQSKFHRRTSSDEQENAMIRESVVTVKDLGGRNSQTASPDKMDLESSEHASPADAPRKQSQKEIPASSTVYSQTLLTGLKQFAFQSSKSTTATAVRSSSFHGKDQNGSEESRRQEIESKNRQSRQKAAGTDVPSSPRSIRQSVPGLGQPIEEYSRQVSKELSPLTREITSSAAVPEKIKEQSEDFGDHVDTIDNSAEIDQQVVWGSFQSTEQVCASARHERITMIQRKHELDSVRRSLHAKSSRNSQQNHNDVGVDDEVVRNVGFENDNDGGDSHGFIRMSKATFRGGLQVIGQFNLGFILAKCSRNHLWILDQHACDEKYNFELLCKTTVIHEQPLMRPLQLELSPSEEACVLDHMDIFEANGFRFSFDKNAPIRHRLSLTALPHSGAVDGRKAVQFGPSDVSALCSILSEGSSYDAGDGGTGTDGSGLYGNNAVRRHGSSMSHFGSSSQGRGDTAESILARLPKAIAMFASRACRKSIMIGTALSQREMEAVLEKMAKVDMPWTCAHGRPTMRHVGNLLPILMEDERKAAEYIATPTISMTPLTQIAEDERQA